MSIAAGDVVECCHAGGYYYAQVTHKHPVYSEIVAIDVDRYDNSVSAAGNLNFSQTIIFPLSQHLQSGTLDGQVKPQLKTATSPRLPVFKFAVLDDEENPIYWWLWDGQGIEIAKENTDLTALPERRLFSLSELHEIWGW